MKHLVITLAALATMMVQADAERIAAGTALTEAQKALAAAKHTQTGLDGSVSPESMALDCWRVDEGVLILVYSRATGVIAGLSFMVMDERPKSTRKEFSFAVDSFDTATGKLVLSTKKPR